MTLTIPYIDAKVDLPDLDLQRRFDGIADGVRRVDLSRLDLPRLPHWSFRDERWALFAVGAAAVAGLAVGGVLYYRYRAHRSEEAYIELTKKQLYDMAKEQGIEGRSRMDKSELLSALRTS
jgi:hypothetical protein